jgi:hypothetical protein
MNLRKEDMFDSNKQFLFGHAEHRQGDSGNQSGNRKEVKY